MSETTTRAVTAPPDKRDSRPIREVAKLDDLLTNDQFRRSLARAVPTTLTPQRVLSTFAGAIRKSPELRQCNVLDVAGKVLAAANAGMECDSPLQQAHLIPFKERRWNPETRKREETYVCQLIFGYRGLLDLAFRSGLVGAVRAEVVWRDEEEAGAFAHEYGTGQFLKHKKLGRDHKYDSISQANGTAEYPTWAYAYATLKGTDQVSFETIPWADIRRVRDNSPAFRSVHYFMEEAKKDGKNIPTSWHKAPWVEHLPSMAAKSAFRRFSNWIPRSVEFAAALALDEAGDRAPLDLGPIVDLDTSHYAEAAVDAAGMSGDPGTAFGDRRDHDEDGVVTGEHAKTDAKPPAQPDAKTEPSRQPAQRKAAAKKQAAPANDGPPDDQWGPAVGEPMTEQPSTARDAAQGETSRSESSAATTPEVGPQASGVVFDEWLLDHAGDPIGGETYDDAVAFARDAVKAFNDCFPPDREAFMEHNAGAIQNACQASQEADRILASTVREESQPSQEAPPIVVVPLRMDRGRAQVGPYLNEFKAEVAKLTPEVFLDFVAANLPTLLTVAPSTRNLCSADLAKRAKEFGIEMPKIPTGVIPAGETLGQTKEPAAATEDPDWTQARNRARELDECKEAHELNQMLGGIVLRGFGDRMQREGKADIIAFVKEAADRARAKLSPAR